MKCIDETSKIVILREILSLYVPYEKHHEIKLTERLSVTTLTIRSHMKWISKHAQNIKCLHGILYAELTLSSVINAA